MPKSTTSATAQGAEGAADTAQMPDAGTLAQIDAALDGRAAFYRMLSSLFWKTLTPEQIESLATIDLDKYAEMGDEFADGINDIKRYLNKRNTGTREELAEDFTGTFVGTKTFKGRTATPYKSVFTSEDGRIYQEGYQEVFTAFKKERVKMAEGMDWPDDHISFMCQFLALLSDRAKAALAQGDAAGAARELACSRDFLQRHILSWWDRLVDVANDICKTRFYRGVLKISTAFFALDDQTLADMLDELGAKAARP